MSGQRQGFADGYNDVASRLVEFREKYPDGRLRPVDPLEPVKVKTLGDKTYLEYVAAAYRSADDPAPGIGVAWEPFPGRTSFTRDSEAMVAETSAWGRAIIAALAADARKGVASADEVRNRQAEPFDTTQWEAQIAACTNLGELTRVGTLLTATAMPENAAEALRKLYRERATELKPAGDAA